MRESTQMEDYDGFLESSKIHHKTKIVPLRWMANLLSYPAVRSLVKAFDLQEDGNTGYRFKFHCLVWKYLNKPYERWGSYYTVELRTQEDPDGSTPQE